MTNRLVVANWKMFGHKQFATDMVIKLKDALDKPDAPTIVLCPPFVYLNHVHTAIQTHCLHHKIHLGAQTVSQYPEGAYTGEIAVDMLEDLGCEFVIVGHSERRTLFNETDEEVAAKFIAVKKAGLKPILCLGENKAERQAGIVEDIIKQRLTPILDVLGIQGFEDSIISYEPLWAIGTGETATPAQAETAHAFIRHFLSGFDEHIAQHITLLYGGSVKPDNASGLFSQANIDGGLIGGASLKAKDFIQICNAF